MIVNISSVYFISDTEFLSLEVEFGLLSYLLCLSLYSSLPLLLNTEYIFNKFFNVNVYHLYLIFLALLVLVNFGSGYESWFLASLHIL